MKGGGDVDDFEFAGAVFFGQFEGKGANFLHVFLIVAFIKCVVKFFESS